MDSRKLINKIEATKYINPNSSESSGNKQETQNEDKKNKIKLHIRKLTSKKKLKSKWILRF